MKKILLTCPPMIGLLRSFQPRLEELGFEVLVPEFVQTCPEEKLLELLPGCDAWIVGDDKANAVVLKAGSNGLLKVVAKWGVGVDNVDIEACRELGISFFNTPGMFGEEVADVALGYLIALARQTFLINDNVRRGFWYKPVGMSLRSKTVGIVGCGDIGGNLAKRCACLGMKVIGYDPDISVRINQWGKYFSKFEAWPVALSNIDFLVLCCPLTNDNRDLINGRVLKQMKPGTQIINVSRGELVVQSDLIDFLEAGHVSGVALDVFEVEPIAVNDRLLSFDRCIVGSHNASNTYEAVSRTSNHVITKLNEIL